MLKKSIYIPAAALLVLVLLAVCFFFFSNKNGVSREIKYAEDLYERGYDALLDFNVDEAYCYLDSANNIFQSYDQIAKSDSCYILLARVYYNFGEYQQAREMMELISDLNNLSLRYRALYHSMQSIICTLVDNDYASGIALMQQSIVEDSLLNKNEWLFSDKANLAEIYIRAKQLDNAEQLLNSIANNPNPTNTFVVQYLYCKGLLFFERKQYTEANSFMSEAEQFAKNNNMQVEHLAALQMLTTIDSVTHPDQKYILHYQEYTRVQNLINSQKKRYQISLLNAQNRLKMRQLENKAQRRNFIYSIIMLALAVLVLMGIALILYLHFKKTLKEKKLVELQINLLDKEITTEKLERELLELRMEKKKEALEKAHHEKLSISMRLAEFVPDKEQIKEDLLKDVSPIFYSALERHSTSITKNDIRLAWLIKQHIPNEEIIRILGLTKQSLYTSRYRLRKRLGLESNADLNTFLSSIC